MCCNPQSSFIEFVTTNMTPYLTLKDHFYSQEEFSLLYDDKLDMLITHPQPAGHERYYHSESYISHSDQASSFIDRLYLLVKRYSLSKKIRLINSLVKTKGSLLDIGAGTGEFLLRTKQHGWRIDGVEPNEIARTNSKHKGIGLHSSLSQLSNNSYDIITLWHVLEHLPNLNDQIRDITNLLKEDGVLVIAVPNFKSYDGQKYKSYWAAYDVPRHFWHFSKQSINKLFLPFGYTLKKTKPMLFDSFYVSVLSEKYKHGKNRYISAFLTGLTSNLKGMFTKEYSSHIYILKKG